MVSKILFLIGMSHVVVVYVVFLLCLFNKEVREKSETTATKWDIVILVTSGVLFLLSALTAHTLGW